jgi:molybdopterin-guanine dinucleotide biosynthesis protein A
MGQNKALLLIEGEPMIARILDRGRKITDRVLVITNRPEDYQFLQVPITGDIVEIKGPLVGLYTALCISQSDYLILAGCDMPWINPDLLAHQLDLLDQDASDIVIPKHEDGFEPLHAVYRRSTCLKAVETALGARDRSLIGWHDQVRVKAISDDEAKRFDPGLRCFLNINTPDEYQVMLAQMSQR